ncbi:putative B12 binding domain protein [Paratrimastix pyriformis]|uniref:B12 binding domain protein n=1 Tax=Paratrimastix pyriformis TaxID=342808 RepID=A0ABQ8UFC7_9EUKA|nr:putative B12 binding domain protein [Paratrimastix pyriformis]
MHLRFFGTSSAVPTLNRNTSSCALMTDENRVWLFDCGEGTQRQFLAYPAFRWEQIDVIFITHLHGDHIYGLFGLLSSMALFRSTLPDGGGRVELVGPKGIKDLIDHVGRETEMRLTFPLAIHELGEQPEVLTVADGPLQLPLRDGYSVKAFPIPHRLRSYGFVVESRPKPGDFDVKKANALGVPFGPMWGKLKPDQVLGPATSKKLCFLGDCTDGAVAFEGATFAHELADKARSHGHSTARMAGAFAKRIGAQLLVLNHFRSAPHEAQAECPGTRVLAVRDGEDVSF